MRLFARSALVALIVALSAAAADAAVTVNKTFAPTSVALGAISTVTVTLQNSDPTADAQITSVLDDVGATMGGIAIINDAGPVSGSCSTLTDVVAAPPAPVLTGNQFTIGSFTIPKALVTGGSTTVGSCTFTFQVIGDKAGNGFNTIRSGDVVVNPTTLNPDPITQTLQVTGVNATVSNSGSQTVFTDGVTPGTATIVYTIKNPAVNATLTNAAFSLSVSSVNPYTLGAVTNTCGGTLAQTLSSPGVYALSFTGATIPANNAATCTVSIPVSSASQAAIVSTQFASNSLTDDQNVTNPVASAATATFSNGQPTLGKSFNPATIQPAGNPAPAVTKTSVHITIRNPLSATPLTGVGISDPMPANITLDGAGLSSSCGGTVSAAGNTLSLTGATIPGASTCTITGEATATAGATNTVQKNTFVSNEVTSGAANNATATLNVTGGTGDFGISKAALGSAALQPTGSYGVNMPFQFQVTIAPVAGSVLTGTISDDLSVIAPHTVIVDNTDAGTATPPATAPTATNCGATPTFTYTPGAQSLQVSNVTIGPVASCVITFYAEFTNTISAPSLGTNTVSATLNGVTHSANANVTELPATYAINYTTSNQGLVNQPLTVAGQIRDDAGITDSAITAVFNLNSVGNPHNTVVAPTPNFTFTGCPAGMTAANITIDLSREFFTLNFPGSITATCTIGYDVINEVPGAAGAGTFASGATSYKSALNGQTATPQTGIGFAQFSTSNIVTQKTFAPNNIVAGQSSTATIQLDVGGVFASPRQTIANNVQFSDPLPAGMVFAANPNPQFSGCGAGATAVPNTATQTIAFSGITLTATGAVPQDCFVRFDVTSSIGGAPPANTITANSITTTSGAITNAATVQASLTVVAGVGIQKTFASPTTPIGSTNYARFQVSNTQVTTTTTGTLTDHLPANMVLTSTTFGPVPGTETSCAPSLTSGTVGTAGATLVIALANVPPYNTVTKAPGTCTVYIPLGAATAAVPGNIATNTIGTGDVVVGGTPNASGSTATTTYTSAPNVALSKAFAPANVAAGQTSQLTISIINTSANAATLTGVGLTDPLPGNVTVAAIPNASTTCGAGTVTAVAGATSVVLANGTVAPGATCTITVNVTSTIAGIYTNTIAASALTSNQQATNTAPASAVLNVGNVSGLTLAKSFTPALIAAGGTSVLQIAINNTMAGAVPLTALQLNDTLPANVLIAPVPNASTTCPLGVVNAPAGGTVVGLAGASLGAGVSCTVTVTVTSSTAGIYVNTIPPNAVSDAQASTNLVQAQATLNVGNTSGVGLAKAFAPIAIAANAPSTLTISIVNNAPSAVALSAMALTDTLPANVHVAATPNAATTCGAGTVTALPNATAVSLAGGSVAANATCTVTVAVTSATPGIYTNTIPANALVDAQASTNDLPAQALLNVANASGVSLSKAFSPAVIAPGATSVLTITLANTQANAATLTALNLVDNLPTNVTVAATPNASTTCTGGTVGAVAAGGVVTLSGVTLAVNATCTVTVSVTGTVPGTYTNTIPANAISTTQGATNAAPAQAVLIIGQPSLTLTKTSVPSAASVSPGESITYTIVMRNGGTQAETTAHLTDALTNATLTPGSVTVNGQPEPDSVVTGGTSFGSILVGQTVTIVYAATVNVAAPTGASVQNTATVLGDQPCNGSCTGASAANTVAPPVLSVSKAIDGKTSEPVVANQTVTYGITVANTGPSPAVSVVVTDPLPAGIIAQTGTFAINGVPTNNVTVNGQTLTIPIPQVNAGASSLVTFNAKVANGARNASNTASVMAAGLARAVQSNPAMANQVPAALTVTKTASATTVTTGDRVNYQIVVAPVGGVAYGATIVSDVLPAGEVYAPGTARVNGVAKEPTVSGRTLIWTLPALGPQATFTYATVIAPGISQNTQLTNVATATAVAPGGAGVGTGTGSASVLVVQSTFGACYPITGRVYLDTRGRGRFEDPDVGLGGVHIYLDDGESVTTDEHGRYDFPCVHPGMHALRLDETTLPTGAVPYDDRNIDSEKSTRRLVHHIYDTTIIEDINFAVTGKLAGPPPH